MAGSRTLLSSVGKYDAAYSGGPGGAKGMTKRGSAARHLYLDDAPEIASHSRDREIVALDEALDALAQIDQRKAKVIELRFLEGSAWKRLLRF